MLNKTFNAPRSHHHDLITAVPSQRTTVFFGTRGLVKVKGKMDGHSFRGSFMAMGDGRHMLPVKAELRQVLARNVGETIEVLLEERIATTPRKKA